MKISSEFVSFDTNLPYRVRIFHDVNFDYPVHYHMDEYEITLTEGCEGTLVAGSRVTSFGNPDLVMTGPGLPHAWYEPEASTRHPGRKVTVIHFKPAIIPVEWLKTIEFKSISSLFSLSFRGLQFHRKTIKGLYGIFRNLQEGQGIDNYTNIITILKELSLDIDYKILSEREMNLQSTKEDERFLAVHSYIVKNFTSDIRISKLAGIANLSDSAFSHYFKKRTLKSFSEFIIDLRLNHAGYMLLRTEKSITEIAYLSGFNSISNFNNLFKRKNGMTPYEFRRL